MMAQASFRRSMGFISVGKLPQSTAVVDTRGGAST
jgi:hypothetical protein